MKTDDIYIGRKAGTQLFNDIKKAKQSVKIVSPYLSPSYIEELVKLKNKGVDVTLTTSNNLEEGDGNYSKLNNKKLK